MNPRLQHAIDIFTWIAVTVLVAALLVLALGYVLYLLGVSVTWVREVMQLLATTAVGLVFGHRRGSRHR